jgi:hypothetical protein
LSELSMYLALSPLPPSSNIAGGVLVAALPWRYRNAAQGFVPVGVLAGPTDGLGAPDDCRLPREIAPDLDVRRRLRVRGTLLARAFPSPR